MKSHLAYKLTNQTIPEEFVWNKSLQQYIYRFSVWRISDIAHLYCEIRINKDFSCEVNLYDSMSRALYGAYVLDVWGMYEMPNRRAIQDRMHRILISFGIIPDPDNNRPIPVVHHMEYLEPEVADDDRQVLQDNGYSGSFDERDDD